MRRITIVPMVPFCSNGVARTVRCQSVIATSFSLETQLDLANVVNVNRPSIDNNAITRANYGR